MSSVELETAETLEIYSLLQLGVTMDINTMDYLLCQRLIYLKSELDKYEQEQMKKQRRR